MTFPFISFLALTLSSAFSPGPNNIMCLALGQDIGFKKTTKYILGVLIGYASILSIVAAFNSLMAAYIPQVSNLLKYIGFIYLIYLAMIILYKTFKKTEGMQTKGAIIEEEKLLVTAMCFQFVNPKAILFGISVFSGYILPYYQDIFILFIFVCFLTFVTGCSLLCWSYFGSAMQQSIKKYEKIFNSVMASLLIYSAIMVL